MVVPRLDDVVGHLRHAQAVVSMGGYNSVCEIMSTSAPALIVPRTQPRAEQVIRARGLAQAGYVDWQDLNALTPGLLRQWLDGRLGTSIDRSRLRLDGLRQVPQLAAAQLQDFCLRPAGGRPAGKARSADRVYV